MTPKTICIAKDYSRSPAGRYESDGPFSGERFRTAFLVPAIQDKRNLVIELDGTRGYGSSFLEEAFGGLVRLGYQKSLIVSILSFVSTDESLISEIYDYINQA